MTPTDLLTTAQVADALGYTQRHVARMADSGEIPYAHKLPGPNGAYLFERAVVKVAVAARRAELEAELERLNATETGQGNDKAPAPTP